MHTYEKSCIFAPSNNLLTQIRIGMKTKFFLFVAVVAMCVACDGNNPKDIYTGELIGTLGCYDQNYELFHKGYFVQTNTDEVILSFYPVVEDTIYVNYGTYAIPHIQLPYSFVYEILSPSDKRYVHYTTPHEDAMHQGIFIPLNEIEQVIITPIY